MEKDWLPGEDFSRSNEKGMERNDTQLQKAETTNYKDVDVTTITESQMQEFIDAPAKNRSQTQAKLVKQLHVPEVNVMVPYLTVEESVSRPSFERGVSSPWKEYMESNISAPYTSGKDFLYNWGISPESYKMDIYEEIVQKLYLELFARKWKRVEINLDASGSGLPAGLVEFYEGLELNIRKALPAEFVTKARMVWDILRIHSQPQEQWSELDKQVKLYSIWHHFFADYHQAADKVMDCIPPGDKFADVALFPDLMISVPSRAPIVSGNPVPPKLVPAIIVENGSVDAVFDEHKDTTKVLAETRMATTYSLSMFDTHGAFCYGVVNGGSKMSVTLMEALLLDESGPSSQYYTATYIENNEAEKTNFTLEYSLQNYKQIISLFVHIHFHLRKMTKYEVRESPLSFSSKQSTPGIEDVNSLKPPKKKKAQPNKPSDSSGQTNVQTLCLDQNTYQVIYATPTTRALVRGHVVRFAKILPLDANGSLPNEYTLLMKLNHPNIIKPIHMIKYDKECWVIFECYGDISALRRCAHDNVNMVLGVLDALNYLHRQGIVHADVKRANVVASMRSSGYERHTWSQDMKPYLIDFGLSFDVNNNPNDCRGTPPFVAPEVNQGHLSPAMDMWAWGLYVFDTFFRFRNITQESSVADVFQEIKQKQNTMPMYPIVELLFDLIWKCLKSDPEERLTAEQALNHPFFYSMKHIKPSYITKCVLGNMLNFDDEDPECLTEEEKGVKLPEKLAAKPKGTPLRDITNVVRVK